jgi:hypothetical protein
MPGYVYRGTKKPTRKRVQVAKRGPKRPAVAKEELITRMVDRNPVLAHTPYTGMGIWHAIRENA